MVNSLLDIAEFLSEGRRDGPGFQVKNCDDRCVQYGLVVHLVLKVFLPKLHHAFVHTDNMAVVAYIKWGVRLCSLVPAIPRWNR